MLGSGEPSSISRLQIWLFLKVGVKASLSSALIVYLAWLHLRIANVAAKLLEFDEALSCYLQAMGISLSWVSPAIFSHLSHSGNIP